MAPFLTVDRLSECWLFIGIMSSVLTPSSSSILTSGRLSALFPTAQPSPNAGSSWRHQRTRRTVLPRGDGPTPPDPDHGPAHQRRSSGGVATTAVTAGPVRHGQERRPAPANQARQPTAREASGQGFLSAHPVAAAPQVGTFSLSPSPSWR